MRYFSIFLWFYLIVFSPAIAYRSGNTSIIGVKQKQSLLDRNYIFDNLSLSQQSRIYQPRKANLNSLSEIEEDLKSSEKLRSSSKMIFKTNLKNESIRPKPEVHKKNIQNLDSENTWNSFQTVNDEELSVKAKIIGRAE